MVHGHLPRFEALRDRLEPALHLFQKNFAATGFWVDDLEETKAQIETNGGSYLTGAPPPESERANRFYEVKYFDPNGIVIDVTENGWRGALKDVAETPDRETATQGD